MRKALLIVILAFVAAWGAGAQNSSVKRLESQRAQLEKDIARLNSMLNQNTMRSSEVLSSLTLVRRKISAREQLISSYDQTLKILKKCQKKMIKKQINLSRDQESNLPHYLQWGN